MRQPRPAARYPARAMALLALAAALPLAACNEEAPAEVKQNRPVLVAPVRFESETPSRTLVATIRPRIESDIGFRLNGKVARRLVEIGDRVAAGQTLAVLDDIDLRLQAEQAEAEQRAARGALAQATAAEQRALELRKKGWSTDAVLDSSHAAADEARGRIARADRAVELTKNSFSYAKLTADAAGIVTAVLVEPGQVVSAGQTAIRVARTGEREAVVAVPETMIERARTGKAALVLWSKPGKSYEAKLRELSPTADATTRTFLAKFSLPSVGNDAEIGMTGTLSLVDASAARVARLPLSALFNQNGGPSVYVVDPATGALTLKPVVVRSYDSRDVVVAAGVQDGDKVVAVGVQKLDPVQKVRVVDALSF
ncbi:efflux RND transporter periplasmic adaptor subunit [Chelatococcus reniformis]|uniref:Multidrug transporter n=1 Tax=Chelatococcus reniformis TaxID=1494448 RepID=A0A916UCF1_9HYPH|nr:efflux RND transporter periplasmic adaptor subunit [Chelatococcus reniformis]GGC66714.1 multidrug transporter [Chelatococcus reniformis]